MLSDLAREYIEKRGWAKADYEALGVYSDGNHVVFPLLAFNGDKVGEVARNIWEKSFIVKLNRSCFGYFIWRGVDSDRVLFLVEGIFDVSWLLANGFHAAAYLSSDLSSGQMRTISRFYDRVVIMPDTDAAGVRGGAKAAKRLEAAGVKRVRVFSFQAYKDIGEAFETGKNNASLVEHLRKVESSLETDL